MVRRLLFTLLVLTLVSPGLSAFDSTPHPIRVALLAMPQSSDSGVRAVLVRQFADDLASAGFEVIQTDLLLDDVPHGVDGADFVIELASHRPQISDHGEIGIGGRHLGVGLSLVDSRLVSRLRVYEAETMEVIGERTLTQRASALLPTSVGLASRLIHAAVALPAVEIGQQRRLARAMAREAAGFVTSTIRNTEAEGRTDLP